MAERINDKLKKSVIISKKYPAQPIPISLS